MMIQEEASLAVDNCLTTIFLYLVNCTPRKIPTFQGKQSGLKNQGGTLA